MLKIVVISNDKQRISNKVLSFTKEISEKHTKKLAEEHKKELDKAIEDSRERTIKPIGDHLKDQIQVEMISGETPGYGVGNIEILNTKAKWWRWLNYGKAGTGRTIPPGTKENPRITGHFVPGNKGIFTKGNPKFPIDPKKAIKSHSYIEKSLGVMLGKIRELLK
jgi:hypothetical protein